MGSEAFGFTLLQKKFMELSRKLRLDLSKISCEIKKGPGEPMIVFKSHDEELINAAIKAINDDMPGMRYHEIDLVEASYDGI